MKRSLVIEIIALLFIILFMYTGISKLIDYTVFREQIATSPLLAPIAPVLGYLLPATEFLVSILLLIPRWRIYGLYASLSLMAIFTGYIIAILNFNKEIPCSCGGVIEGMTWREHIVFNGIFFFLALIGIQLNRRWNKISRLEVAHR